MLGQPVRRGRAWMETRVGNRDLQYRGQEETARGLLNQHFLFRTVPEEWLVGEAEVRNWKPERVVPSGPPMGSSTVSESVSAKTDAREMAA